MLQAKGKAQWVCRRPRVQVAGYREALTPQLSVVSYQLSVVRDRAM
jgi:hypothetical protein